MLAGTPVVLLREGTERATGEDARHENLRAAVALAESVRTTLGPRGMDKMLVDPNHDVVITNDGATILRKMEVEHPAAKMLAELARAQDVECGDGTKTAVILAGEILKHAEELLDRHIHPTQITEGFRQAADRCVEELASLGETLARSDTETLRRIAITSMISKGVASARRELADLAVRAVAEVVTVRDGRPSFDRSDIQIVKRNGERVSDSELVQGHIVEKGPAHSAMPRRVAPARIALLQGGVELEKTQYHAEIRLTAPDQQRAFLDEEERELRAMVAAVTAAGANVVLAEKGIDEVAAEAFARQGVYAVARVPHQDLGLLAKATGAQVVD